MSTYKTPRKPAFRNLRGYAFDPSLSLQTDTVEVNKLVYKVEWEELRMDKDCTRSFPSGEYIEIVDVDPATGVFYHPVDLDNKFLLASNGLEPSVGNPQFHQQMVYAVIMTTIKNFEKALGRKILWSDRIYVKEGDLDDSERIDSAFVPVLRIYPHALRQANAYYNPLKKSILFGYFPAKPANAGLKLPGETIFTCLSHDIIAHETTHAILDGLHRRYVEPTHADTRAFHEAFADIVALFQHFTFPEVLRDQISRTRGNLASQNLLGQLAQEFGKALGNYGSLRDAIGHTDPATNQWIPHIPDPNEYQTKMEFHDRGAILVAAVFDAFLTIYKQRVQPLLRIATGGTGVLPDGQLHPDLVDQLARIASKTASHILSICVRAIDYCPPVDITFGDFLRALISGDKDMVVDDDKNYRVAFIEAFQKRGIFPKGIKSMSVEVLCYHENPIAGSNEMTTIFTEFLREFKEKVGYLKDRGKIYDITSKYISGSPESRLGIHQRINIKFLQSDGGKMFSNLTGLLFPTAREESERLGLKFSKSTATYEVGNLRLASRVTPQGKILNHVVITLLQRRGVYIDDSNGDLKVTGYFVPDGTQKPNGFVFRGGCTLIFDLDSLSLRYAISKHIDDKSRMELQYRYVNGLSNGEDLYFSDQMMTMQSGPFAFMHTHQKI